MATRSIETGGYCSQLRTLHPGMYDGVTDEAICLKTLLEGEEIELPTRFLEIDDPRPTRPLTVSVALGILIYLVQ